jgi:hypothetical protein
MSRECHEALLLAGKIIAARANIMPDEEPCLSSQTQSGSPMSLDEIYARTPDLHSLNDSGGLTQMNLDGSSLLTKQETMHDSPHHEVLARFVDEDKGNQGKPTASKRRGRRAPARSPDERNN